MHRLPNSHRHENWQRNCRHLAGLRWLRQYLLIKTCPDERVSAHLNTNNVQSLTDLLYCAVHTIDCLKSSMLWGGANAVRELLCYFLFLFYLEMWERTVAETIGIKSVLICTNKGQIDWSKNLRKQSVITVQLQACQSIQIGVINHGKSISAKLVQIKVTTGVADGGHRPFPSAVRSHSGAVGPGFLLLYGFFHFYS